MAGFLQDGFKAELVCEAKRAEFDNDFDRFAGHGNRSCDAFDRFRARKAGHDDWCLERELPDVAGGPQAGVLKLSLARAVDVEADDAPAAFEQIARDRASHDAEPDDTDRPVHAGPLPSLISIDGQCRPRLN